MWSLKYYICHEQIKLEIKFGQLQYHKEWAIGEVSMLHMVWINPNPQFYKTIHF